MSNLSVSAKPEEYKATLRDIVNASAYLFKCILTQPGVFFEKLSDPEYDSIVKPRHWKAPKNAETSSAKPV